METNNSLLTSSNNTGKTQFDISIFEIDQAKAMVNLTTIANHFGKEVRVWRQKASTKTFLDAFFRRNPQSQNLIVVNGGTNGNGTWASRKLALKFAEWISVDFEIYANEVINELFTNGKVELPTQQPQSLPQTYKEALLALIGEVEKNEQLTLLSEANAPLVDFANQLLESSNGIDFGTSAKALNLPFGRNKLFAICREQGWLFGKNQPKQALVDEGYFVVLQTSYVQPNSGDRIITFKTLITAKGETWLVKKLKQLNIIK